MDTSEHQPAPPQTIAIVKLAALVMVAAAVGMTAFLLIAFREPLALLFGVPMILTALAMSAPNQIRGRLVRLAIGVVLIASAIALAVLAYVKLGHNPSAFAFGGMITLTTVGLLLSEFRDESTR